MIRIAALCSALLLAGAFAQAASTKDAATQAVPIRAAFYYPWFPQAWKQQGMNPFTKYHPSGGLYDGGSASVIASQVRLMQGAGLNAMIASWFGPGSSTDAHIPAVLSALHGTTFKVGLYYEVGGGLPSASKMRSDLDFVYSRYAKDPSYLHVNGRPVLFVYNGSSDGASCTAVSRLKAATAGRFYLDLKVFTGFRGCASQPDSWHQYGPAVRESHITNYSYTISPGFNKASESSARLPRSVADWSQAAKRMVASREEWQLVTTFNEWGEGTAIEPAKEWGTAYLDSLRAAVSAAPR
jgi:hypothetical protein